MTRLGKILVWIGATGLTLTILGFIAAILIFNYYNKGLPSFEKLAAYNPAVTTRLYAANSKLVEEYAIQHRVYVPFEAMPPHVWQAGGTRGRSAGGGAHCGSRSSAPAD